MLVDAMMHDAALAHMRAAAVRRPSGYVSGVRRHAGLAGRRGRVPAAMGGVNAVVALLLLILMPLGLLHRASTGACRYDHRATAAGSAAAVNHVGLDAWSATSADHDRTVIGEEHDHRGSDLPLDGAAPSACGPAILVERAAPMSATWPRAVLPVWRARSPLAPATAPPSPPPRLS